MVYKISISSKITHTTPMVDTTVAIAVAIQQAMN